MDSYNENLKIQKIKNLIENKKTLEEDIRKLQLAISNNKANDLIISALSDSIEKKNKEITENDNLLKEERAYLISEKRKCGESINAGIIMIGEEIEKYNNHNKNIDKLDVFIDNIKGLLTDICEYQLCFKNIESLIDPNTNFRYIDLKNTNLNKNISDNILPANYEFSLYNLKNKHGFSLKDFFNDYTKQIKEVYDYYEGDINKTIEYLQKKHGLAGGRIIQENTFKLLCINYSILPPQRNTTAIKIKIDNRFIEGKSNKDVLKNFILEIGIANVFNNCKDMFSTTFEISTLMIKSDKNYTKHLDNGVIYYLIINLNKERTKLIVERIKAKLNIPNYTIID